MQNKLDQSQSEIGLITKQARLYYDENQNLTEQINGLRDKLQQTETLMFNASSAQDMQLREIAMLKMQLD